MMPVTAGIRYLALASLACLVAAAAQAQVAGGGASTIIVLDGSNSMNNKLPGDAAFKHVMARETIRNALPKLGPGTQVGLAAFGHRRPSDCTDVELIQPPTTDPTRILAPLEKFQAKGFSPVVLALRTAARALPAGSGKASLILILDDLASCRGDDPCKVASDLKKDNPALAIHVVGLGLKPADAQVLGCVAQQTGGRLFNAQDGRAAAAGIDEALQLASAERAPAAATRPAPAAASKGAVPAAAPQPQTAGRPATSANAAAAKPEILAPGVNLIARLADGRAAIEQSVRWRVAREGALPQDPPLAEASQPRLNLPLANGRYLVEARAGLVSVSQSVEVTTQEPMLAPVLLNASVLSLSAPLQKGGEPSRSALLSLFQTGQPAGVADKPLWLSHAGADDLVVPAGSYRIVAEDGLARTEQTVTLAAGVRREVELVLSAGRLVVDASMGGNDPLTDNVQFIVEEDDPDSPTGKKEIVRTAAARLDMTLPAGSYQVTARRGSAEARERLGVKAGEDTSRSIALAVGRVRLASRFGSQTPAGVPITYRIERLDGPPRPITRGGEAEPILDLSPGRYRFEARIGAQNAIVSREVDVRSGLEQRIDLNASAGGIKLKLSSQSSGLGFGEVFWQIYDERGRAVWRTSQIEPSLVLAAGKYTVSVELRERSFERTVDVRPGESRVFEVGG